MPFNRRQMLQLMTSLAVTTACPAMAWEPESPVELELLHAMPGQDAYFRQVAEAFTAKNPKIRIRFRASPANYPEAHQSILRAAITNKLPDIYHSAWIYFEEAVRQLKKRNAICDVTDLFKAEGDAWAQENYYQSMIDIGTVDGRLYALPFAASTPVFFYNADLVKAIRTISRLNGKKSFVWAVPLKSWVMRTVFLSMLKYGLTIGSGRRSSLNKAEASWTRTASTAASTMTLVSTPCVCAAAL